MAKHNERGVCFSIVQPLKLPFYKIQSHFAICIVEVWTTVMLRFFFFGGGDGADVGWSVGRAYTPSEASESDKRYLLNIVWSETCRETGITSPVCVHFVCFAQRMLVIGFSHVIVLLVSFKFRSAVVTLKRVTGVKLHGSKCLFTGTTEKKTCLLHQQTLTHQFSFLYHATLSVYVGTDESILTVSSEIWERGYFGVANLKVSSCPSSRTVKTY